MTFHIRRRLKPRGGNNFYRDKNDRATAAYCGGEMTSYDVRWRDKALAWTSPEHGSMVPCAKCLQIRQAEGGVVAKAQLRRAS